MLAIESCVHGMPDRYTTADLSFLVARQYTVSCPPFRRVMDTETSPL